jgi:hypothetical protein
MATNDAHGYLFSQLGYELGAGDGATEEEAPNHRLETDLRTRSLCSLALSVQP